MKKPLVKKVRAVSVKPAVKAAPSKPVKTGLKKSDPEYYRKIGQISAEKRKISGSISHEQLSAWGKLGQIKRRRGHPQTASGE